jgi:hypothetical protein
MTASSKQHRFHFSMACCWHLDSENKPKLPLLAADLISRWPRCLPQVVSDLAVAINPAAFQPEQLDDAFTSLLPRSDV